MLFCITANYTAKALAAMRENPGAGRKAAIEKLVNAAGGKVVSLYFTTAEGPGAHVIIEADGLAAAAVTSTVAATDSVRDVKMTRLWTEEEAIQIRKKRVEIQSAYKPPGQ